MSGNWKRKDTGWENILAIHISDKGLVPGYLNTNQQKDRQSSFKMCKRLEQICYQRD